MLLLALEGAVVLVQAQESAQEDRIAEGPGSRSSERKAEMEWLSSWSVRMPTCEPRLQAG